MSASVFDTAKYILDVKKEVTAMKLQKLVYYSQAWSLVWDSKPLFQDRIEAWANGPVSPALYCQHKGLYNIKESDLESGDRNNLSIDNVDTINAILKYYGDKSSQWLSDLTHIEDPWKTARKGILDGALCNNVITHASMEEYYSSLPVEDTDAEK